ncbi:ribosomal RNA processing protein 4 [Trypanosoma brucei brucei TREU927]|uniref:Ribosomal RNA processing protein 4 n=2 Tax=Trypanosoma brucei TaxID=5691 RepID=Q57X83_TRYB2|nr:ribosomal RNA processing protein 4 [Trypanosoma brucei brucei TREU927]AAX69786.1 ribosomal RNA processing protein 4 [Trypanosoma brucei]AAZ12531.1 ribosomal RNA processing protein 4 [Trypanosoma brucei brucei TREU927]
MHHCRTPLFYYRFLYCLFTLFVVMSVPTCITGDTICGSAGPSKLDYVEDHVFLRGYNTYEGNNPNGAAAAQEGGGEIIASINGMVEVTDRVVSVKGMSSRYVAEVGDIVVGRVKEVCGNRWRVDVGAFQDAVMPLANVTEPGGILRRRGRSDELTMRNIFDEGELVVAEVQRVSQDGLISLHTRSGEKYGKLSDFGLLVLISPALVKRVKHHFMCLEFIHVNLVLGTNGAIWVSPATATTATESAKSAYDRFDADIRRAVTRVANCIRVMGNARFPVFDKSIEAAVKASIDFVLGPFEILYPGNQNLITTTVLDTINTRKRTIY